jgi:hypothetical protein
MSAHIRLIALAFSSLFLIGISFGQPVKIEGEVKGVNNKPAKGADLRIDRVDKKAAPLLTKTNAIGQFAATVPEVGTYKVTATLPGGVQSAQVLKADAKKRAFVIFDMNPASAKTVAAAKKKRYVWVPTTTGTHMLGHYEEVREDGSPSLGRSNGDNIEYMSGRDLEGYSRTQAAPNGAAGGIGPGGR